MQVLTTAHLPPHRYNHMEHYSAHHDFFDPAAYASSPDMLASVEHGARNRLATVFFYLNNVSASAWQYASDDLLMTSDDL